MTMNRRDFLRGLLGGAALLTVPQAAAIERQLEPNRGFDPEFHGKISARTELTVLSADNPKARKIGWEIRENIGIGVIDSSTPEERRERAERRQEWLDSLPEDYGHEQHMHLCSTVREYSSLEMANAEPDRASMIFMGAPNVATRADLPDTDPEQTVRVGLDTQTSFVQVDGVGWGGCLCHD